MTKKEQRTPERASYVLIHLISNPLSLLPNPIEGMPTHLLNCSVLSLVSRRITRWHQSVNWTCMARPFKINWLPFYDI